MEWREAAKPLLSSTWYHICLLHADNAGMRVSCRGHKRAPQGYGHYLRTLLPYLAREKVVCFDLVGVRNREGDHVSIMCMLVEGMEQRPFKFNAVGRVYKHTDTFVYMPRGTISSRGRKSGHSNRRASVPGKEPLPPTKKSIGVVAHGCHNLEPETDPLRQNQLHYRLAKKEKGGPLHALRRAAPPCNRLRPDLQGRCAQVENVAFRGLWYMT